MKEKEKIQTPFQKIVINRTFQTEEEAEKITNLKGWSKLVMDGYGFIGNSEFAKEQFDIEYGPSEDKREKKIFVLGNGGAVVASTGFVVYPELIPGAKTYSVGGIVVGLDYRKKGLGSRLYGEAIKEFEADIVVGQTKNPDAVIARAKSAERNDMRTFYGPYEVTPNLFGEKKVARILMERYILHRSKPPEREGDILLVGTNILPSFVPDVIRAPDNIKLAFHPVIQKQREKGDEKAALMTLISVKKDFLKEKI